MPLRSLLVAPSELSYCPVVALMSASAKFAPRAESFVQEQRLGTAHATLAARYAAEPFLNHAVISPYLNVGLLDPLAVCRRAEAEWRAGAFSLRGSAQLLRA